MFERFRRRTRRVSGSADRGTFADFTDRGRRVMVLAQEEARLLDHHFIGTEHILLGLIQEGDGVAAKALESLGISLEAVREKVEEMMSPAGSSTTGSPPLTPGAAKVLELSRREAGQLGHNYIGTEHMLLGLVREGEGVGAQILISLGGELSRVRQQVIQLLVGYQPAHDSGRPLPNPPKTDMGSNRRTGVDPVQKLRERLHVIEGLLLAVEHWAEISDLVQAAQDRAAARAVLVGSPFSFSEVQAEHILDTPQARRTILGRRQLLEERDRVRLEVEGLTGQGTPDAGYTGDQ